jgi:hypothetical protein
VFDLKYSYKTNLSTSGTTCTCTVRVIVLAQVQVQVPPTRLNRANKSSSSSTMNVLVSITESIVRTPLLSYNDEEAGCFVSTNVLMDKTLTNTNMNDKRVATFEIQELTEGEQQQQQHGKQPERRNWILIASNIFFGGLAIMYGVIWFVLSGFMSDSGTKFALFISAVNELISAFIILGGILHAISLRIGTRILKCAILIHLVLIGCLFVLGFINDNICRGCIH